MTDQTKKSQQKNNIEQFIKTLNSLTDEERVRLQEAGLAPMATVGEVSDIDNPKLGYRCSYCNRIGLYFTGEKFTNPDGTVSDTPSLQVPVSQLPWRQRTPLHLQDRVHPRCQCCGSPLKFRVGRKLRPQDIVSIQEFEAARDESYSMEALQAINRKSQGAPSMGASRDYVTPTPNPSERMSEEAKEDIMRKVEQTGLMEKIANKELKVPTGKNPGPR